MKRTKNTLKSYFKTGEVPSQWQYENLIDSFWHVDDLTPSVDLGSDIAKKNEDNLFSSLQTFNGPIVSNDAFTGNSGIDIYGDSSFDSNLEINGLLNASAGININQPDHNSRLRFTRSGHAVYGVSLLDSKGLTITNLNSNVKEMQFTSTGKVDFNAEIVANNGIESNGHIKLKNNGWLWSQYSATDDELRLNANSANGWDFFNQTNTTYANIRAGGAEFNGLISAYNGIRVSDNQYLYLGNSNDMRMYHNGSHSYIDNFTGEFLIRNLLPSGNMQFVVDDSASTPKILMYLSGSGQYVSLRQDGNEKIRTISDGIQVDRFIKTPTNTSLSIIPHGGGNIYLGNGVDGNSIFHYSNLNDGKYTTFTHNSFQSVFDSTHSAGFRFNKGIQVHGDVRTIGDFVSSDGSVGYTGSFIVGAYDITVKNGIITTVTNIS